MGTIWFCLVALMIAIYVLLDGFDLGAGAIHLLVAKTDTERRQVLASIGPVWDGNEVWLLAAGGTLYFAFPALYASGFSGFYLPLMMVLWLLILRGSSIEFRNHIKSAVWRPLWDFLFSASSLLLAVFLGAALANVVRGVPLDSSGYFFEPLWTDFRLGEETGMLDWDTIVAGADDARRAVGSIENAGTGKRARAKFLLACLVGRGCANRYCDRRVFSGADTNYGEICDMAFRNCITAACGDWTCRRRG